MQISAAMVKELRERTGSGMMECKKALQETEGDMEAAVEHMRKTGLAKADKKADRVAAEGMIAQAARDDGQAAAMVEINSETDFVARESAFQNFAHDVAQLVLERAPADEAALLELPMGEDGKTVHETRQELIAKIKENIRVRRFAHLGGEAGTRIGRYRHGDRIGVLVQLRGGDEELGKDLAMHIAASHPIAIRESDVPEERVASERAILTAQAQDSGKPEAIIEKMVEGRLKKFYAEVALLQQPFVKDPERTVGDLVKAAGAEVLAFQRFEVGEGIEKEQKDFRSEVMDQVRDAEG
jgi:elongation factor Ts